MSNLYFETTIEANKFYSEVDKMKKKLDQLTQHAEKQGSMMDGAFKKAATAVGGYFTLQMFGRATKGLYQFSTDFETALTEVATISDEVFSKFSQYKGQILDLSTQGKQSAKDLTSAFYDIVSAGYDGQQGLEVLRNSVKASTAGFVETATAADGLTTVLNAWGKDASEAEKVSDVFFKTVEKGKTRFVELASNIAQVAPIASSMGVSFEEIAGATASLTKQGTPTAQAMTQIRSSLLSMNDVLGDGWAKTMTYQEGLQKVLDISGGSQAKLQNMLGRVEAVNAVLGLTGDKAKVAASDLEAMNNALGSTAAAAEKVQLSTADIVAKLRNNILAALEPLGEGITKKVAEIGTELNEAFENGKIEEYFKDLAKIIKVGAALMIAFKANTIASAIANNFLTQSVRLLTANSAVLNRWMNINNITMANSTVIQKAAIIRTTGLANAFKTLFATMAANPLTAIIAVLGLAVAGFMAFRKRVDDSTDSQKEFNDELERTNELLGAQQYTEFLRQIGFIKDEFIELADGSKRMVSTFDDSIDVLGKFGESVKKLREGELENYKKFFEDEIVNMQRGLEGMDPNSLVYTIQQGKLEDYRKNLALVLEELKKIEELRKNASITPHDPTSSKKQSTLDPLTPIGITKENMQDTRGILEVYASLIQAIDDKIMKERDQNRIIDLQKEKEALEAKRDALTNWKNANNELYKELFADISTKRNKDLKEQLAKIDTELQHLEKKRKKEDEVSIQEIELTKKRAEIEAKIWGNTFQTINDISGLFGAMSGLLKDMDSDLSKMFDTASKVAGSVAGIVAGISTGNYVQVATSGIQLITSLVSTFSKDVETAAERMEKAAEKIRIIYDNLDRGIDGAFGTKKLNWITQALDEANKQFKEYNHLYEVGNGKYIGPEGVRGILSDPEESAKLTEEQRNYLQQQIELYDEAKAKLQEYQDMLDEMMTGTTLDALSDEFTQLFIDAQASGEDFTETFAKGFEDAMKNALISQFKNKIIMDQMEKWYREFADMSEDKDGLTTAEMDQLRKDWFAMFENAKDDWENIVKILPEGFDLDTESAKGLVGAIRKEMTEETASELVGLWNRTSLDIRAQLKEQKSMSLNLVKIEANTFNTVRELQSAVTELKGMHGLMQNNSSQSNMRDAGI